MGIKHTLLETPPESVPHELAQTVIDFAKTDTNVTRAFIGRTSIQEDFQNAYEQLAVGFVLADESAAALQAFADRFYAGTPEEVQAGGCNVLEPAALADWSAKAQQVFAR
jgi:hypothetical protein